MFTDYIKGYVVIKIDGIGKERFITLCGKRSIVLKNIYMQNNVYYARLSWDEYRRIPEIVHRTAVEAVLVEKHGLPFLLSGLYKEEIQRLNDKIQEAEKIKEQRKKMEYDMGTCNRSLHSCHLKLLHLVRRISGFDQYYHRADGTISVRRGCGISLF